MYDYHIHSSFSMDCNEKMESVVQRAIKKGMKEICFTDHLEYDLTHGKYSEALFDPVEYGHEINRLKEIYGDQLSIKKGVEIGVQPHLINQCNDFITKGEFDFVICSLHTVERQDIHYGDFLKGKTASQAYAKYFEDYYHGIKSDFNYSVIGHYDFLKRYIYDDGKKIFKDNFEVIEATLKHIIENGKGIEINTSGFRYHLGHTLPTKDILKLYKELGGEIITTGSDAHDSKDLGDQFEYACGLLRELGLNYLTTFENMTPKFIKL